MYHQNPFLGAWVIKFAKRVIDLRIADLQTEVIPRDRFEVVTFVEDNRIVIGQNAAALSFQCQVAKEQRVIDDQNLRIMHPAASCIVKATIEGWAFASHAISRIAGNLVPNGPIRTEAETAEGTIVRCSRPILNCLKLLVVLFLAQ